MGKGGTFEIIFDLKSFLSLSDLSRCLDINAIHVFTAGDMLQTVSAKL
jgi:hypothetical protein